MHTPGPWRKDIASPEENERLNIKKPTLCIKAESNTIIGLFGRVKMKEAEANLNLIVASPDMLDALNYLENYVRRSLTLQGELSEKEINYILKKPMNAIKKATGTF